jgi:predicted ATP-grasp superfamily ATP-dependent carboligase
VPPLGRIVELLDVYWHFFCSAVFAPMNVLVLDGNENQAVAAVRALRAAGHTVVVGAETAWSKAAWSRDCAATFRYPGADRDAAAFVTAITAEAAKSPGTLVLPMTERTTLPLSASRDVLFGVRARLVVPSHDTVLRTFDKQETTRLAHSLGIDVPRTALIASAADLEACAATFRYPVVLKPRSSQELSGDGLRSTGAPLYARNPDELRTAWAQMAQRCTAALAQEFVEGTGTGYFALMRDGELRAEFAHRRIRDVRPTGSGSALRIGIAPPPALRDAALKVLSALRWHGVAMVEFRVRADGTPTFLEVNGRFWNSLALALNSGVNFPALLAEMAEQGDVDPVTSFRTGVRCRWLLGDVRHLVEVFRGPPQGYPGVFPSRLATLAAVACPVAGTYHDNFSWRDPLPELGDWLHFAFRKLPAETFGARGERTWHAARRPSPS